MKKLPARLTSTHIDRHNDRMALSALESLVTHINTAYLPVGIEHDPRIPPVGRIASAEIKELEDGEYAVDAILDIFESGDIIELTDSKRLLPIHENIVGELHISYDRNFRNAEDQILIKEIGELFDARPQEEMKKALDPITVLTIGGAFLRG